MGTVSLLPTSESNAKHNANQCVSQDMNLYKPISERGKGRREGRQGRERERKAGTEGRKEKREGVEERECTARIQLSASQEENSH